MKPSMWLWASGLLAGNAAWSLAVHEVWLALGWAGMSFALALVARTGNDEPEEDGRR